MAAVSNPSWPGISQVRRASRSALISGGSRDAPTKFVLSPKGFSNFEMASIVRPYEATQTLAGFRIVGTAHKFDAAGQGSSMPDPPARRKHVAELERGGNQISKSLTSRACSFMNEKRFLTSFPINVSNTSSVLAASPERTATLRIVLEAGSMVVLFRI